MAMLALYWSIMIACYLLASRLRKYAEKFKFVDKLMSLSVYALVLLMGLRMGADYSWKRGAVRLVSDRLIEGQAQP